MWGDVREAYRAWNADGGQRMGAALAYYTVFSLAPLALIAVWIAGTVLGSEVSTESLIARLHGYIPPEASEALRDLLHRARRPRGGGWSGLVGLGTLLLGASYMVGELQSSLDKIWKVTPRRSAPASYLRRRFVSIAFVLAVGFLLLVSLVLSAVFAALGRTVAGVLPLPEAVMQAANGAATFGLITLLFATIFKLLPDARVAWRDVWSGAAITALMFVAGNALLGLYLGKRGAASAHGAAGSLVLVMVWTYYCAQILYFGAELASVRSRRRSPRVQGMFRRAHRRRRAMLRAEDEKHHG